MKANEIYERVSARIVEQLRSADPKAWRAPWHGNFGGLPYNAQTGVAYRGGNVVSLWIAELDHEYALPVWATYNQWHGLGAQVRKGEYGVDLIKWVTRDDKATDEPNDREAHAQANRRRMFPVGFKVFNIAQVDDPPAVEGGGDPAEDVGSREYFKGIGATIKRGEPAYHPSRDVITMPPVSAFHDETRYWSTVAHEHVHWTGHATRLDREGVTAFDGFGTPAYAAEELVAELGAAFLCASLGIEDEPREDHARYLASWITLLTDDAGAFYRAASLAQRAVDYLDDRYSQAVTTEGEAA